ncbi:binding-protein-dependent transport systems inner membrane component [Paenibacillus pini JCM 16418]|uniref:Binding-protein-dependent transport systems inner membrane component n=2 Tax=Paenibacillus TaxID=44249 RepID=W7YV82_9BACL|nr:binding-protein-dependent transport systems inner membrane component [Paenibacillus pini JCM 16418]
MKKTLLYVFSLIAAVIFLYPLLYSFFSSLKDNVEIYNKSVFSLPEIWRWENYKMALVDANISRAILNSFIYAIPGTLLCLVLALMIAFVLTRMPLRINPWLYNYFAIGLMIPVFSLMIPISKVIGAMHLFNSYPLMIVLYGVFEMPLAVFLITGYMRGISKELDESAIMDGCGPVRMLFRIIAPLAMPAVSTAGILSFFDIYNDLVWNVILISDQNMNNISMALMSFVGQQGSSQLGPTFAGIMLTILPTIVVYLLFQEKVEKGLSAGAVKE